MTEYKKNCPLCGKEQFYKNKYYLRYAIRDNKLCTSCAIIKSHTKYYDGYVFQKECLQCKSIIYYSCYHALWTAKKKNTLCKKCSALKREKDPNYHNVWKYNNPMKKREVADKFRGENSPTKRPEIRKKMSDIAFVVNNKPDVKEKHKQAVLRGAYNTPEAKENYRKAAIKRIERQGGIIAYNPEACKAIDEYGKKYGYNFQHALNGGEVRIAGYSLDGYDKERNTVIEFMEKHHNSSNNKIKDAIRKSNIISKINCSWIELYDDKMQEYKMKELKSKYGIMKAA